MENHQADSCSGLLKKLISQYASRIRLLSCKPEETVEATVRALWLCASGVRVSSVEAMGLPLGPLTEAQTDRLHDFLDQRVQGVPLAYLTRRQRFMGLEYHCNSAALIPRQQTEVLARAACRILVEEILPRVGKPQVLDLCTGCGNLACAVARQVPECTVFASDLSLEATRLAEENARLHGCEARLRLFVGDLFTPFKLQQYGNSFDLIICNPPYINTASLSKLAPEIISHEPTMALDAGPFGLGILSRLLSEAPKFAKPEGWLAFEVAQGQADGIIRRLSRDGRFTRLTGLRDGSNQVQAIAVQIISS